MRTTFKCGTLIAFWIVAFILAGSQAMMTGTEPNAQLSGRWIFNPDKSDDVAYRIKRAKDKCGAAGVGTQDMAAHEMIKGGVSGNLGGPEGDSFGLPNLPEPGDNVWIRLAANPKFLLIDQQSEQIVVTDDSGQAQTFYPDGKKHQEREANGKKVTVTAGWKMKSFVAQTKLTRSRTLTQTFAIGNDGLHLLVTTRLEVESLPDPLITIRRVYDPEKPPAK